MRRDLDRAAIFGLLLLSVACRGGNLTAVTGALVFSSPDQPTELAKPDAGVVQIAFGSVLVGSTATMTLAFASLGSPVTLGTVTAVLPDSEFSLPFMPNTVVDATPSQITVSFAPTSAGNKSATFQLTDYAPGTATVLFELSGEGIAYGLTVAPNPVDFGQVEINQVESVPVTITNSGQFAESFVLSALEGPNTDRFSLGAPSVTSLEPGASATLDVTFGPLVAGVASASFTVGGASPDEQPVTVNLSAIGTVSWIQTNSPLDFGFIQLGDSIVKSAMITNLSKYTTIRLVAPAPALVQPSAPFSLASTVPAVPAAIAPGQSVQVPILFRPGSYGSFSGLLYFTTDDHGSEFPVVALQGYGGGPQIACIPSLSFGPVAVGSSSSQDAFCTNVGTAISSLPKIGLQIAQKDLTTDNPAFVPRLVMLDGGVLPSGYSSVTLTPGQQARIRVAFQPEDAGPFVNRLIVPSNDINDLDAGTLLLAEGGLDGSCNLQVTPMALGFDEVPPGGRGVLPFELSNTSQALCHIAQLAIGPGSDPAFSLLDGGIADLTLSYAGSPDTPAQSSFVILDADFEPTTAEGAASGTIDITTLNAVPLEQSIALTGVSEPACLSIEPPNLDFGLVGFSPTKQQICGPVNASFVASNNCATTVTVNQLVINSGLDAVPQFTLQDTAQLPLAIAPGRQVTFQASFTPTYIGPKLGAITVSTTASSAPFLVSLQGDAKPSGTRTDSFTAGPLVTKVDLLWVLDNDDDSQQAGNIAGLLPQLIANMNQDQLDYQIAVTSTDTCDGAYSDQGSFEPCDHCLSSRPGGLGGTNATFVTSATSDPVATLADLFNLVVFANGSSCRASNGDEHFFDSIADAFSPGILSGHNAGFIRDGAYLAVVVVNGDNEDDAEGLLLIPPAGPYLTNLAQVTTLVESLKVDPSMVSVSYINSGAASLDGGQKIGQLVQNTGGVEMDTTEPAAIWQQSLLDLFALKEGIAFHLTSTPVAPSQIEVDVNGKPATGWTYDPGANLILFEPGALPPQGATITVTYELGCP